MDKERMKLAIKQKLQEQYLGGKLPADLGNLNIEAMRQAYEAYIVINLLDSSENPFPALFKAIIMNLCNDSFSQKEFWYEILSECCNSEELEYLKVYRLLNIWGNMSERAKARWMEDALALLEENGEKAMDLKCGMQREV